MNDHTSDDLIAFSGAVDGLYAAAMGELGWPDAIGRVAGLVDSPAGTLNVHNPVKRLSRTVVGEFGTDPTYSESFNSTYGPLSSFSLVMMLFKEGNVGRIFDYEGRDKVVQGRFYKEWCAPQGYNDFLGALLVREPEAIYGIGFVRMVDQPLFTERDEEKLSLLVPHITRAFRISGALDTLRSQRQDLLSAIDLLPTPIIALDAERTIVNINQAAIALTQGDGPLRTTGMRLSLVDPDAQKALQAAFRNGVVAPASFLLGEAHRLQATLAPFTGSTGRTAAILTVQPLYQSITPPGLALQQAFGFTPAELRVLVMLLEGGTRETIARDLGLQNLFAKTDTNRQADLVRVVMGGGPV
jgi:DNA-binding CsgD family transcriptional regulator/PAS domain-containing protein